MKYLVTGGAGFIGSHLVDALGDGLEHDVLVLDDFSTGRKENLPQNDHRRLDVWEGDVADADLVEEAVRWADGVFHLASVVGVRKVVDAPAYAVQSIVVGAANVLRACAIHHKPVLVTSSSEVYGRWAFTPYREDGINCVGPPTALRWAYATAKLAVEYQALGLHHTASLPVVVTRLFNTIGPRQTGDYGMVVPRLVKQALAGEPLTVYGDGRQMRCFCHVADVVGALAKLDPLRSGKARGEIVNVGSDEQVTIRELAKRIIRLTGSASSVSLVPYERVYGEGFVDMRARVPDLSKLHRLLLGWNPRPLAETLRNVIEYEERNGLGRSR